MKIKVLCLALLSLLLSVSARADFYASVGAGFVKNTGDIHKDSIKVSYKNSPAFSAAFGYTLPVADFVRFEAELLHNKAKTTHGEGSIDLNALMANAYLDLPLLPVLAIPMITPYIGVGLGYGRLEDTNVIPLQAMVGIDAEIFYVPLVASAEYRFLQTNTEATRANERDNYYAHILMLKLRYEF